jgi:hypothetical protein
MLVPGRVPSKEVPMRQTLPALLLLTCLAPARADDREKALEVVNDAVRAHGGAAALEKAARAVRTSAGFTSSFGREVPFTDELVVSLPDRMRLTVVSGGTQKTRVVQVVNGDKGWVFAGGRASEMGKDRLSEMREEVYLLWVTTLAPLSRDTAFTLAPLPEEKVNGRPVVGVKVTAKGHTDVRLYFDRETSLLVKAARKTSEAGVKFEQEYLFGDHKEFEGVRLPTKVTELRDGRRATELGGIAYKFPRSIEATTFDRP